jgi:D,D-heptose 1,7-bisphosphate phosphatase
MISVAILAGGFGTRLKEIYGDTPKPLVKIRGVPMLEIQIEKCVQQGFKKINVITHYGSSKIIEYIGDGRKWGVEIKYHVEEQPKGTAGALLEIAECLGDRVLVLFADTYFDIDLNKLVENHTKSDSDATIFSHPNDHPFDSDLLDVDSELNVRNVLGYPHKGIVNCRNLVSAGLFVFNTSVFKFVKYENGKLDIAKHMIPAILRMSKKVRAYISPEYIKDAGTPERIKKVEIEIESGLPESLSYRNKRKGVLLDRDGTIIEDVGHLDNINKIKMIDGAAEAIRRLNKNGYIVLCVTNQPVVARGAITEVELAGIHNHIEWILGLNGAYLDKIYYCPHHPDSGYPGEVASLKRVCCCRKPAIGLIKAAEQEYDLDLSQSWLIGDSTSDIQAARNASVKSILVTTGLAGGDRKYMAEPDHICNNLTDAVDILLSNNRS